MVGGDEVAGGAMAGKGSSAAKLENSLRGHGFRRIRHGRKEKVEASSPRALVGTSKHRRRRVAWRSGWRTTALGCGAAAALSGWGGSAQVDADDTSRRLTIYGASVAWEARNRARRGGVKLLGGGGVLGIDKLR